MNLNWIKKTIKLLYINILIFIGLLIIMEILSAIYLNFILEIKHNKKHLNKERELFYSELKQFRKYEYDSFIVWKNKSNIKGKYINTDNSGRRVTIQEKNYKKNTIHFFGGSTMWGHSVFDSGTIPSQFAKINKKYRIINWGEQAYNSRQELNLLLNNLNEIKKGDIVVFFDGVNDVYNNCKKGNSPNGHVRHAELKKIIEHTENYLLFKLINKTNLYQLIKLKLIKKQKNKVISLCGKNKEVAITVKDFLINDWQTIESIVEKRDAVFIPILQPNPFTAQKFTKFKHKHRIESTHSVYPLIQKDAKSINNFYDMSSIFKDQRYYLDCCHLNRKGNAIIAKQINNLVEKIVKKENID